MEWLTGQPHRLQSGAVDPGTPGTTLRTPALNKGWFAAACRAHSHAGVIDWKLIRRKWPGLQCRNCGDVVDPRRVELGYDYCLKDECQRRCVQRVELAAVGVNKAADYYMRADEVLPPPPPGAPRADADEPELERGPIKRQPVDRQPRPKSTLERLDDLEATLDAALDAAYARFGAGDITAREMHDQQDRLIDAFNQQIRSENIRYRSRLRPRPFRSR